MPSIYEGGRGAPRSPLSGRFFYARVEGEGLYDLFDLLLNELQLLAGAFTVQHPVTHGDRDAVHVLDLGDDLFSGATESNVSSLVGQSAVAAALEVLRGELSGDFDGLGDRAARDCPMIGNSHLVAIGIAEPQPADVLNTVISETERYPVFLAVDRDRADRVLCYAGV